MRYNLSNLPFLTMLIQSRIVNYLASNLSLVAPKNISGNIFPFLLFVSAHQSRRIVLQMRTISL